MKSSSNNPGLNYSDDSDQENEEILQYLMLIWSRKLFVAAFLLLGCLLGVAIALSQNSLYQADALIHLETKKSGISLSQDITDLMSSESDAITEMEIVRSRMVLGKTVREQQLDIVSAPKSIPLLANLFTFLQMSVPEWDWLSSYGLKGESLKIESLSVVAELQGVALVVKRLDESQYQVESPDGTVLNGSLGQMLSHPDGKFQINVAGISARPGVEFFVRKVSELAALNRLRSSLRVSEKGRNSNLLTITLKGGDTQVAKRTLDQIIETYVSQNIGRSSEEAEKSIRFLEKQLPIVQNDLSTAENDLNEFRLRNESIDLAAESASVLERMVVIDTQLSELSLEEAELSRLYTQSHPRYTALLNRRAALISEKESLTSAMQTFPKTQQEILKRTRNLEVNQHIYLQLLNKKQELNVLKASTVGSVRIIDRAAANPIAVSPNRSSIVVMCAFLATILGCGIVLVRSFFERNVDSPDDISKLNLPVYATIPRSVEQNTKVNQPFILARDNPAELSVEALRSLRTSLHFGMLEDGKGIVSITGPAPGIGKSFVAANLAYLCAESGSKVLLIDTDMRRGTVAQLFGFENKTAGLSELLAGTIKLEQAIRPIAVGVGANSVAEDNLKAHKRELEPELEAVLDGIDLLESDNNGTSRIDSGHTGHLSILPRGKAPPNPSELLMQGRLPNLLREAAQSYDLVILDTPPVLAVTDAMIVGRYADMNLMVVRHNQTRIKDMEQIAKVFSVNSVELSGAILNGYDQKASKYGQYGYAYGYQYQYESVD